MRAGTRFPRSARPLSNPGRRASGVALVAVLWVVTLLTVIAASLSLSMRREAGIVLNLQQSVEARFMAEAGVAHAMLMLDHPDPELRWTGSGEPREVEIAGVALQIRVRDVAGFLDLNHVSAALLDGLVRQAGIVDDRERARIVDNILDWRDPDGHRRLHADGRHGYEAVGRSYGPRQGPFVSVEELALVLGVTPTLYRRLAPHLTIHGGHAGIDPAVADPPVLRSLPDMDAAAVEAFIANREVAWEQGLAPPPLTVTPDHLAAAGGIAYNVESIARLPGGQAAGLSVFITRSRDARTGPFVILSYRDHERPPAAEDEALRR